MSKSFCYYLLQRGLLKRDQFIHVLDHLRKDAATIERLAVDRGYLSKHDAEDITKIIARDGRAFLPAAHELGFMTKEHSSRIANAQMDNADYLREVLEGLGFMPPGKLRDEFEKFKARGEAEGKLVLDTEEILKGFDESAFSHRKFMDSMIRTTAGQFEQILNMSAEFGEIKASLSSIDNLHYLVMVDVDCGLNMVLFLSIDETIAGEIARSMLKTVDTADIPDCETRQIITIDCIKEFFNIICGHTRSKLLVTGIDIAISPPEVEGIIGKSKIGLGQSSVAISSMLETQEGNAVLGFIKKGVAFNLV